jgi:CRISPR-associated endonuclease Cas1
MTKEGSHCLIVDGYGLHLGVERGHLIIADRPDRERRIRRLSRSQRDIRRIVILGHVGEITLAAVRWCADVGIALVQIDTDGRVLMVGQNPARTDARLLRAQAAAAGDEVGVVIARQLLAAKIEGQAAIAENELAAPQLAEAIRHLAGGLEQSTDLRVCRDLEAQAANVYFAAWTAVGCRFAKREQHKVPQHWYQFDVRSSRLSSGGHSPRNAADPINALLNYSYALAEAEARLAALTVGLDPGLGIVHADRKDRDSLALDLVEPLRPIVERHVLRLLAARHFTTDDVVETRDGRCRLLPPQTHEFADQLLPELRRAVAKPAEAVAHLLAGSSPGKVHLRRPLSRANITNAQTRGSCRAQATARPTSKTRPTCQKCGVDLYGSGRKLCPTCWPVQRREYMRQLGKARAKPIRPAKQTIEELSGGWTLEQYQNEILPGLAGVPLPEIERATGLSNASCSRVTRGLQIPNPRWWNILAELARGI